MAKHFSSQTEIAKQNQRQQAAAKEHPTPLCSNGNERRLNGVARNENINDILPCILSDAMYILIICLDSMSHVERHNHSINIHIHALCILYLKVDDKIRIQL